MANPLKKSLAGLVKETELRASETPHDSYTQTFHLMPPVGWLNDPNGLHQTKDAFIACFQYSPFDVAGGLKFWGKSSSKDLVHWDYEGCALYPDSPYDVHGVYSGSVLTDDDGSLDIFYTGNVKFEDDPNYDYIHSGRGSYTMSIHAEPGQNIQDSPKVCVLGPDDYPKGLTQHIRDPKVWRAEDGYHMLLGARDASDTGCVLHYVSSDKKIWALKKLINSDKPFGYMWECPDYMPELHILSLSPQGLTGGAWDRRNVYQSGFFPYSLDAKNPKVEAFKLWDAGFDFYAPQSFVATDGRRIMIAWMGMPDEPKHINYEAVNSNWQHCFSLPREIYLTDQGKVAQRPIRELESYRQNCKELLAGASYVVPELFDLELRPQNDKYIADFTIVLAESLRISYVNSCFSIEFIDPIAGGGRRKRFEYLEDLTAIRIIKDTSSLEIFFKDLELSFSTRLYLKQNTLIFEGRDTHVLLWDLNL